MGMFSFVPKIFKKVAKPILKITKPVTGPVLAQAPKIGTLIKKQLPTSLKGAQAFVTTVQTVDAFTSLGAPKGLSLAKAGLLYGVKQQGVDPMALNIGNILGTIGGVIGKNNASGNSFVSGLGGALTIASAFVPQRAAATPVVRKTAPVPMRPGGNVSVLPRAVSGLTQEIFNAGTKVLGRLGIPFTSTAGSFSSALRRSLGSIASLARRTPAGTIVSILAGLGLTALEANMLAAWYAQRKKGRRMNPANSRALRRAARRIKSFHRLCTHTDVLKTRGRSRSVGRCGSCRKSPCSC